MSLGLLFTSEDVYLGASELGGASTNTFLFSEFEL